MLELFWLLDDFIWLLTLLEVLDCLLLEVLLDELSTLELFWLLLFDDFIWLLVLLEVLDCLLLEVLLDELSTLELFWLLLFDDFN